MALKALFLGAMACLYFHALRFAADALGVFSTYYGGIERQIDEVYRAALTP